MLSNAQGSVDCLVHKLCPWEPSAARGEEQAGMKIEINFYHTKPERTRDA